MPLSDEVNQILSRLAKIRRQKKLTYDDISARTTMPTSLIEQIEKGTVSPSTGALKQIAKALDIRLVDLLQDMGVGKETLAEFTTEENAILLKRVERKALPIKGSKAVYSYLTPKHSSSNLEVLWHEAEAGATGGDWLSHEGEECCYVLKGRFRIFVQDEIHDLNEGDCLWFQSRQRHKWENPGKEKSEVIWAISPPWF
jgi:mannose-6-phosphate isomerase-like protein (cupin superfamily)